MLSVTIGDEVTPRKGLGGGGGCDPDAGGVIPDREGVNDKSPEQLLCCIDYTGSLHCRDGQLPYKAWDIHPMLAQCCASVFDAGATLSQHWVDVLCLLITRRLRYSKELFRARVYFLLSSTKTGINGSFLTGRLIEQSLARGRFLTVTFLMVLITSAVWTRQTGVTRGV